MLTVACFLWRDPFSPKPYEYDESYVHELKARVSANLSTPHQFVCVADRHIQGIRVVPIDWRTHVQGTRFNKLMLFNPAGPLAGRRVLYLDLDCVITGALDPLVNREDDLCLWRNPNYGQPGRARYNTSIILHTVGTRPEFFNEFSKFTTLRDVRAAGWGGTDQAWISMRASNNEAHWTDADGVYGHGRLGDAVDGAGTSLPDNARIVFFPGNRTQRTDEVLARSPWIKKFAPLKYTGEVAANYDAKRQDSEKWKAEDRIIESMLSDLPPDTCVVDVPVGTGRFIPLYERLGFKTIGIDVSADMLGLAAQKITTENVRLRSGDARALDLNDGSVDVAVCIRLFRWLEPEDVRKVLRELQRVARRRVIFNIRLGPESHPKRFQQSLLDEAIKWRLIRQEEIVEGFWMIMLEP